MQDSSAIKLRHISIKDYKGIEHLELDFPAPELPGDPDVVVIGSENGLGKTSVLECCALLRYVHSSKKNLKEKTTSVNFFDLLVRAGTAQAAIDGEFSDGTRVESEIQKIVIANRIDRANRQLTFFGPRDGGGAGSGRGNGDGTGDGSGEGDGYGDGRGGGYGDGFEHCDIFFDRDEKNNDRDFIRSICGLVSNPVIEKGFLFFHSYRKVLEGSPRFGTLLSGKQPSMNGMESESLTSVFKRTALFSMMSSADLFDSPKDQNAQATLDQLNALLERYADCRFTKLRPTPNDTIELRVQPINGGDSFNFDGLSSGQKEIITTLFLIWHETRNQPKVVLIDEPELHLNSQWHRSFINSLFELAPRNQYIIATHSSTIMDSVDRSRRILLQRDKEAVR